MNRVETLSPPVSVLSLLSDQTIPSHVGRSAVIELAALNSV
jgi:hypothetical protein